MTGRRVLITGAAGGQGRAVARRLLGQGARLALCDRDGPALDALLDELGAGDTAVALPIDVRREEDVRAACAVAVEAFGGLDALYNNAGVYWPDRDAPVHELERAVWDDVLAINTTGVYLFCKHAIPALLAGDAPVIVNVASTAAHAGDPVAHAYAASKGALLALTRSIAQRYGPEGLRAIALCPGFVDTPMVAFATGDPAIREQVVGTTALRRLGRPEEIAAAAAFLLSAEASFITSCAIDVHGGLVK